MSGVTEVQAAPGPMERGCSDYALHLAFGLLVAITFVAVTIWSHDYVHNEASRIVLVAAIIFAMFMAFNIGGNDVANSFGTSVGAGTLTLKQALLIAAVFEVGGAVLAGGAVTDTVRSGIVDISASHIDPMDFVFIMMAAMLGAAVWLILATFFGWPVSTTHSIIGGIVGAALMIGVITGAGVEGMVQWGEIGKIASSWVISPLLGGLVAWVLFSSVKRHILIYNERADEELKLLRVKRNELAEKHQSSVRRLSVLQFESYTTAMARDSVMFADPRDIPKTYESDYYRGLQDIQQQEREVRAHRALEHWVPIFASLGAVVISSMLLFKGFKNLHLNISPLGTTLIIALLAMSVWMMVFVFAKSLRGQELSRSTFTLFSWLQVFTAAAFAFSHGANDISNAIGPFSAVIDVLRTGEIGESTVIPTPALIAMGIALVVGLWFVGRRVIQTVGSGLTKMHPASGFSAELAAAFVVMAASVLGIPVSSTHILIGAVLGVGIVNSAANWKLMKPIALAWVVTIPASALTSAICVIALRAMFG